MDPRKIDLMIVGAPRAASTSLLRYLGQHPEILAQRHREMTYFADRAAYDGGLERALGEAYGDLTGAPPVLLAKHVMLMYSSAAIDRLVHHNPRVKAIVLLREPVERAYSHYWLARRNGWEELGTFEEALAAEPEGEQRVGYKRLYLGNSSYLEPVRRLQRVLGEERLRIFLTEDLEAAPAAICAEIFELAGVDPGFEPRLGRRHNAAGRPRSEAFARWFMRAANSRSRLKSAIGRRLPPHLAARIKQAVLRSNRRQGRVPPIAPQTRARLVDRFRPHNLALADAIGRDLSHWNR